MQTTLTQFVAFGAYFSWDFLVQCHILYYRIHEGSLEQLEQISISTSSGTESSTSNRYTITNIFSPGWVTFWQSVKRSVEIRFMVTQSGIGEQLTAYLYQNYFLLYAYLTKGGFQEKRYSMAVPSISSRCWQSSRILARIWQTMLFEKLLNEKSPYVLLDITGVQECQRISAIWYTISYKRWYQVGMNIQHCPSRL